jgi:hypothetical protein
MNRALSTREVRRLALARAGLLKPEWTGLTSRAKGRGKRARTAALDVVRRFGFLQLDTVSIAGARSHTIVLLSRLAGMNPCVGEELLQPGEPLFEYWGHEASWIPLELYPAFEFRRKEFHVHPWWGDLIREHPNEARKLRQRVREEGPLRSIDMEGRGSRGWWDLKVAKRIATAFWSKGEFAIRERRNFQRSYDLTERVIPNHVRARKLSADESYETLLLKALEGHGWATTGTLAATWRLRNKQRELTSALTRLVERGVVEPVALEGKGGGGPTAGWLRSEDRELLERLRNVRPQRATGVLLSPFDPVLWDRPRVRRLFDFDQCLEIFKPASQRVYGYYCLPVLSGEDLIARFDLKAHTRENRLEVLSCRFESTGTAKPSTAREGEAARTALARYAEALELDVGG